MKNIGERDLKTKTLHLNVYVNFLNFKHQYQIFLLVISHVFISPLLDDQFHFVIGNSMAKQIGSQIKKDLPLSWLLRLLNKQVCLLTNRIHTQLLLFEVSLVLTNLEFLKLFILPQKANVCFWLCRGQLSLPFAFLSTWNFFLSIKLFKLSKQLLLMRRSTIWW